MVVLGVLAVLAGALAVAVAARGPLFFLGCETGDLLGPRMARTTNMYAADGSLLTTIGREQRHQPVTLAKVSPWLVKASIAAEDRRFYDHGGVDYVAVVRALVADVREGEVVQGASTITQQLVRNLDGVGGRRNLGRKLEEACLAVEIERDWSKDRILEAYLNQIYYGNRAYGAEAAARTYFSKSASELTLEEAALLAGLPRAPSQLDPVANSDEALAVREAVLAALRDVGAITGGRFERARRAALGLRPSPGFRGRNGEVADTVLAELVRTYGAAVVRRGGLRVYTTIDPRLQRLARAAVRRTLNRRSDPAAALVAMNPRTGAIRALVSVVPGREAYAFNLAVNGRRQSGSTFKPFVLVEAIRRGINPWATKYLSAPFAGPPSEGRPWRVETYDQTYGGRVTIADATLRSDNTVYARLTLDLGPGRVAETAHSMGIESRLGRVPSVGLGTGAVSVLETAVAFSTLASGGLRPRPLLVRKVVLADGRVDRGSGWGKAEAERVLSDAVAFHTTRVLAANVEAGTGTAARIDRPAAGKMGTTENHADAWFAGYTPDLAAVVWMGYPTAAIPMERVHGIAVVGGTFPALIWQRFAEPALAPLPARDWRSPSERIDWKRFCGRFQFARTAADARPRNGCPKRPKRRPPTTTSAPETTSVPPVPPPPIAPPPTRQTPPPPPPATTTAAPQPPGNLVGRLGFATTVIDNAAGRGEVEIDGERWSARSETGEVIPAGTEVEVVRVDARFVYVQPVPPEGG
jgi:penicillin-binding protein 1A